MYKTLYISCIPYTVLLVLSEEIKFYLEYMLRIFYK